jgi:hypothetical protein
VAVRSRVWSHELEGVSGRQKLVLVRDHTHRDTLRDLTCHKDSALQTWCRLETKTQRPAIRPNPLDRPTVSWVCGKKFILLSVQTREREATVGARHGLCQPPTLRRPFVPIGLPHRINKLENRDHRAASRRARRVSRDTVDGFRGTQIDVERLHRVPLDEHADRQPACGDAGATELQQSLRGVTGSNDPKNVPTDWEHGCLFIPTQPNPAVGPSGAAQWFAERRDDEVTLTHGPRDHQADETPPLAWLEDDLLHCRRIRSGDSPPEVSAVTRHRER